MSKLITRASVAGTTLAGSALKSSLTGLVDALNSSGIQEGNRTTVAATSTLTITQCGLVLVDATSASIVLTLPTSGTATDDAVYLLRRIDSSANTVTVQRGGTDTVEGATTALSLASGGGILGLQMPAGGTNWRITNQSAIAAAAFLVQAGLGAALIAQTATAVTSAGTAPAYTITTSLGASTALAAGQRFRVKFHAAGTTGSNSLNRDGLGAKNLMAYDAAGNKVSTVVTSGQLADVEYDGTDMVILDPLPGFSRQIQSIGASVAANALTLSAGPLSLDFRSATLGSGTVTTVSGTPANLVVPSGATLGTVSAAASRLVLLALNNAGTIELAVVNIAGGVDLSETGLISTTAISASATAANVVYSTTSRTSVAYRVIGLVDSTQTTAGTWASAPTTVQGAGGYVMVGSKIASGAAVATTSGSAIDFTSIPAWVKRVTVMFNGVSGSGTSNFQMQLGSGSIQTTGYLGGAGSYTTGGGVAATAGAGLLLTNSLVATDLLYGSAVLTLVTGNTWLLSLTALQTGSNRAIQAQGSVTISGALDRIRLTTVNGTDTFDAGSVNISWE